MSDAPFGRQPQPVTVEISGNQLDVDYWRHQLIKRAEFKGDTTQVMYSADGKVGFKIYPRAVND